MSHAVEDVPAAAQPAVAGAATPIRLSRRVSPSAVWTLFGMTVGRLARPKRLIVLGLLYMLPIAIIAMVRYAGEDEPREAEAAMLGILIPHVLLPLTALLNAPGLIQDEVEEQTLTYLLLRPLPRWLLYVTKLAATVALTAMVAAAFAAATEVAIWWGHDEFAQVVPVRATKLAALYGLSLVAYNALFGAMGLFVKRSLALGVMYIIVFEGIFSNIDFVFRSATVMYYFRVLVLRWLGMRDPGWSIDLEAAPGAAECVATVLVASLVLSGLAAFVVTVREFRVKTPEAA